ncbi:hypothetical protein KZZ52_13760 [Dactylosporangium sp. AC04546]|uniref:NYN domain-containing protein n=1 Tax=Dactylosporangium sp. AC04546 TaxID=2862460 RepID=UPI001EDF32C4|nr:hypothetical protein [Dactylosporangium sp. AC04546]WVK86394.1 hypothetical protein KZZ52_13760 [Dactylosporangium sp. AC04546]
MTAISLVIDASNVAYSSKEKRFVFARVAAVRDAWRARDPEGQVHAVIDASIWERLVDQERAVAAEAEHWLTVAPGDADDEILRLADEYGAKVVSRDNFAWAADRYAWLHRDRDRLYEALFYGDQARLRRRPEVVLSPERIAEAIRRRAQKAGDPGDLGDQQWRCTNTTDECRVGGQILRPANIVRQGGRYYCWVCRHEAREEPMEPPVVTGPATVTLLHGTRVQWTMVVPTEGMEMGRGSSRRPHVVDVTGGLSRDAAREISGEHLRLALDHTGLPVAVHLNTTNVSFVNPALGADGLPADNRMAPQLEYPLWPGDEVVLGPGDVRLLIDVGQAGS